MEKVKKKEVIFVIIVLTLLATMASIIFKSLIFGSSEEVEVLPEVISIIEGEFEIQLKAVGGKVVITLFNHSNSAIEHGKASISVFEDGRWMRWDVEEPLFLLEPLTMFEQVVSLNSDLIEYIEVSMRVINRIPEDETEELAILSGILKMEDGMKAVNIECLNRKTGLCSDATVS